jgi:hypothetical protein
VEPSASHPWAATARVLAAAGLLSLGGAFACAGPSTRGEASRKPPPRESPFPAPEELEELAARPPDEEALVVGRYADVNAWELGGPFPSELGDEPITEPRPFEEVLLEAVQRRPGLLLASQAMRCAAREFGHFFLDEGKLPGPGLQRFVMGRCGATGMSPQLSYYAGPVPSDASDAEVALAWRERAVDLVHRFLGSGPRTAGIWLARRDEQAVWLLVSASRRAHLQPTSASPGTDGWLRLQGEVLSSVEELFAQVNQGRYGVAGCEPDPSVQLPRFSLACPVDPNDESAWVSLLARAPGRLLADSALQVLSVPDGSRARSYRRPTHDLPGTLSEPSEFAPALVQQLNRIRSELGHRPVTLAPQQSETARELAPFYFGAAYGNVAPAAADLVALGLMAGYEVPGLIREAGVAGALSLDDTSLDRWLAEAFEQPGMRHVLLQANRSQLAVGSIQSAEHGYLAAVIATYALYEHQDPRAERDRFYDRLTRKRGARSLTPLDRDAEIEDLAARHVADVERGAMGPDEALGDLLQEASRALGTGVKGWYLEGSGEEEVPLPDELIDATADRIGVAVGAYQPTDSPWGRSLVLVVLAEPSMMRSVRVSPGLVAHQPSTESHRRSR